MNTQTAVVCVTLLVWLLCSPHARVAADDDDDVETVTEPPSVDHLVSLNQPEELQLVLNSRNIDFKICNFPKCYGKFLMWYRSTVTDTVVEPKKNTKFEREGWCPVAIDFSTHYINQHASRDFVECVYVQVSDERLAVFEAAAKTPCVLDMDRHVLDLNVENVTPSCNLTFINAKRYVLPATLQLWQLLIFVALGVIGTFGTVAIVGFCVIWPKWKRRRRARQRAKAPVAAALPPQPQPEPEVQEQPQPEAQPERQPEAQPEAQTQPQPEPQALQPESVPATPAPPTSKPPETPQPPSKVSAVKKSASGVAAKREKTRPSREQGSRSAQQNETEEEPPSSGSHRYRSYRPKKGGSRGTKRSTASRTSTHRSQTRPSSSRHSRSEVE